MLVDIDSVDFVVDRVEIDNLMICAMVDNGFLIYHVGMNVWRHF